MKESRLPAILIASIALIAAVFIATRSWERVKTRDVPTLSVTGSAKKRIVSDLIVWSAQLEATGPQRLAAYTSVQGQVKQTVDYLTQQGIKPDEIQVSSATVQEMSDIQVTGSGENRVEKTILIGHKAHQTVTVTSSNVKLVEKVSREITQLLASGLEIVSQPPAYYYTKLGDLKIEMLAEASKDARNRASNIVESAGNGGKLGKLRGADMGVININPANSTANAWDGNNDTSSLEKDIITIVHCSFAMNSDS